MFGGYDSARVARVTSKLTLPRPRPSRLAGQKAQGGYRTDYPAAGRQLGASATGRVNPSRRDTEIWRNLGG